MKNKNSYYIVSIEFFRASQNMWREFCVQLMFNGYIFKQMRLSKTYDYENSNHWYSPEKRKIKQQISFQFVQWRFNYF